MNQYKRYTLLIALTVALGGFVWGFDATVISGAVPFIQKYFNLAGDRGDFLLGLVVSSLGWGVVFFVFAAGGWFLSAGVFWEARLWRGFLVTALGERKS